MILNENALHDNQSEIEVGDWFSIMTTQGGQFHAIVNKIGGNEIILRQNSNKLFILYTSTSIDEDVITLFTEPGKKEFPLTFKNIVISDKDRKPKFNVVPEITEEPDTTVEDKIIADVKANRADILSKIAELDEGQVFDLYSGETVFDSDGEANIKDGTETKLRFKVIKEEMALFTCELVTDRIEGKYAKFFSNFKDEEFYFYMNSKLINTSYEKGVALQLWHESNQKEPIIYKDVYLFDLIDIEKEEGDEDDEDEVETKPRQRSIEDMLGDKDLMKLMNHQSVWDKVLGRKAKGIVPMDNLMKKKPLSTIYSGKKKKGQKISFIFQGKPIEGRKLSLIDGQTYHGYMSTDDQIKLTGGKNTTESILLKIGKMVQDMYFEVAISHKHHDGTIDKSHKGLIKIIK